MFGIVAAIYSSFCLAIGQGALKKSYKDFEPSISFFFDALFGLVLWIPLALCLGVNLKSFPEVLLYATLSAILSEALYFYALSKGQLSITSIIVGSYPIYTILFSYFINHERLTSAQAIFIALTILGTLISYLPSKLKYDELKKSGAIFWPLVAAIGIGLSDTLSKSIINKTTDFTFLFTLALVQVPVALIYLRLEKQKLPVVVKDALSDIESYKFSLIGSLFNILGTGLLWISFYFTLASIASPITATSGAIIVLLSVVFLDEKLSIRSFLGLVLVFIGIMGISRVS